MRILNLDDLEENNQKKFLILVFLIGIVVLIIFISLIISIWSRPLEKNIDEVDTNDKKIGNYSNINFSFENQVNLYFTYLNSLLNSGNYEDLYKLLDEQFIQYASLDKEKFIDYIKQKNIIGKNFKLVEYKNVTFDKNNIIKLSLQSNDSEQTAFNIIVKEKSPNDYTIAFDNLVKYIEEKKEYEENGLKIELSKQSYFSNEYITNIKISNVGKYNIELNRDKSAETIYLNQGGNNNVIVSTNIFMGQTVVLNPDDSINYNIRFLIPDFTFGSISKIVLKDVTNISTNNTQDIEIDIKK